MTPPGVSHFDRLLNRLHRRQIAFQVIERGGVGLVIAAPVAIAMVFALPWPMNAALVAALTLAGGAILGATWGLVRRPSRWRVALLADRQLNLCDLLSTALAVREDRDDPWALSLVAVADAQCRALSPSSVVLRRFGARAWGSIGLSALFVFVVAGAKSVAFAPGTKGTGDEGAVREASSAPPAQTAQPLLTDLALSPPPGRSADSNVEDPDRRGDQSSPAAASERPDAGEAAGSAADPPREGGDSAGRGRGSARTSAAQNPLPTEKGLGRSNAQSSVGLAAGNGGGGMASAIASPAGGDAAGFTAGAGAQTNTAVPWASTGWGGDADRARQAIQSGLIPSEYRNLVRAYFSTTAP